MYELSAQVCRAIKYIHLFAGEHRGVPCCMMHTSWARYIINTSLEMGLCPSATMSKIKFFHTAILGAFLDPIGSLVSTLLVVGCWSHFFKV